VHHPLLVCTYTNAAVDNLVEGFIAAGLKPLRVGYGGKIKPSLYEHTLDAKLDAHPLKPAADKVLKDQESTERKRAELCQRTAVAEMAGKADRLARMRSALVMLERQILAMRAKLYAMHQEMLNDITAASDVVSGLLFAPPCYGLTTPLTDLHDMHYVRQCCTQCPRFSRRVPR